MANGEQILSVDLTAFRQFAEFLRSGGRNAVEEAWKTLSAWGEEYKRRVQRVTPVGPTTKDSIGGTASQSWQLVRDKENLTVTIGSSVKSEDGKPYIKYLEYGTDRIAGGRVKKWKPGDAPIMEWPAKLQNIPNLRLFGGTGSNRDEQGRFLAGGRSTGTQRFERHVNLAIKAFTAGQGEQMPMLRPIGYEIAPQIAEDVSQAMREGFESVLRNRRNGGA